MIEQQLIRLTAKARRNRALFDVKKPIDSYDKPAFIQSFNPETDVVISRGELEALQTLKFNSDVIISMAKQVEQLHKLQTGELFNPDKVVKKLTPKEKRELEDKERKIRVQQMINKADRKLLNNL